MNAMDAIKARIAAATPGPWEHDEEGFMGCGQVYTANGDLYGGNIAAPSGDLYPRSGYSPKDDMILIAHAPTDMARLIKAVEAVLDLHSRDTYGECRRCTVGPGLYAKYPCATVRALTAALEAT